jgi:hypothetical protein
MKASKIYLPILSIFIFSSLFFSTSVYGALVSNYEEIDDICQEITTLTTLINITDGTDFDFVADEDYLIITSAKFGGQSGTDQYIFRLLHNATTFDGSELNYELPQTNNDCASGDELFNYFFYTLWTPNATEATQDIILEAESLTGTDMQIDDVTMQVITIMMIG